MVTSQPGAQPIYIYIRDFLAMTLIVLYWRYQLIAKPLRTNIVGGYQLVMTVSYRLQHSKVFRKWELRSIHSSHRGSPELLQGSRCCHRSDQKKAQVRLTPFVIRGDTRLAIPSTAILAKEYNLLCSLLSGFAMDFPAAGGSTEIQDGWR